MSNKGLKNVWETSNKGTHYAQTFCPICRMLITGTSRTPDNAARSVLGAKLHRHKGSHENKSLSIETKEVRDDSKIGRTKKKRGKSYS